MKLFGWELKRAKKAPVQFLGDLVRMDLKDGDVCVLMTNGALSQSAAERIRETWRLAVGDGVMLVVLDQGMRMGVLSPPKAAEVHARLEDEDAIDRAVSA